VLTHLQLRDLAIVDFAELEFDPGLTALTGETGAGKSIIVDALLLAAGGRAGADVVRHGTERAEISATVTIAGGAAADWLREQSIDHDGEVIIRRVVGSDGRSRAYLNGQVVPLQALRDFAEFVLEIHGQQEFQRLVKRAVQRELLDAFGVEPALLAGVREAFLLHRDLQQKHAALQSAADNRDARLDLLRYQAAELAVEVTDAADIEQLFIEQKRLANRGRLAEAARTALGAVYEGQSEHQSDGQRDSTSAYDLLGRGGNALRSLAEVDPALAAAQQLLADASIAAREAGDALRRYLDDLDVDPARVETVERRAAALEALARKHRIAVTLLPAQRAAIAEELADLEHSDANIAEIAQKLSQATDQYRRAAAELSAARRTAANDLGKEISNTMQVLGMAGGKFVVDFPSDAPRMSAQGDDEIEFLVSANPGQPPRPLAKVASGGELSRISLAIQVAASGKSSPYCMVFDEVDAGVGGAVAEIVGRRLRELGQKAQVLCVTHLPQVASQAHTQFRVAKLSDQRTTKTTVIRLSAAERVEEIARMLGGVQITDQARAHAREMLEAATQTDAPAKPKRKRSVQ
jgi:DNA repair protein RecN (Recombination protein N)